MHPRSRLFAAASLLVAAAGLTWFLRSDRPAPVKIQNVILISIDTCRADHLSCYGYEGKTTPHIDAVAREGALFTQAMSTNPITLPSHCSMLTGTIPPYHGVRDNHNYVLDEANTTLAERLQDHGFRTAAFIGAFVLDARFGLDQGFDRYDDDLQTQESPKKAFYNERRGDQVNAAALAWLDKNHDEKFFAFFHYFDPHAPYDPPPPFDSGQANPYAGEIAFADHCVGQVIAKLKRLGIYDSTMIIITSDHGEGLGEHGEDTHSYFIYQSTIRVPLIVKASGIAPGTTVAEPVSLIDIVPTVLECLNLPLPVEVQGRNLAAHTPDREGPSDDRSLYCESLVPTRYGCNGLRGVVHGRWKYIRTLKSELYDLKNDPSETRNLIHEKSLLARDLEDRFRRIMTRVGSPDTAGLGQVLDTRSADRLRSLGYVGGGSVVETFEVDPELGDPKYFLDLYKNLMVATSLKQQKRWDEAEAKCLEILARRPQILHTYYLLGQIAADRERYAEATNYFSQYLERAATNDSTAPSGDFELADVCFHLGKSLDTMGRADQAIEQYRRALEIFPAYPEALTQLVQTLGAQNRIGDAVRHCHQALKQVPDSTAAHFLLGRLLRSQGDLNGSIKHFGEVLAIEPDDEEAHFCIAESLYRQNRKEEAIEHLRKTGHRNASTISKQALTMLKPPRRDPEGAVHIAEVAAELTAHQDPAILDTLAAAYAATGQFEKAVAITQQAISLASDSDNVNLFDTLRRRLKRYKQSRSSPPEGFEGESNSP